MPPAAPIAPLAYAGDPGIGDQGPESVRQKRQRTLRGPQGGSSFIWNSAFFGESERVRLLATRPDMALWCVSFLL